MPRRPGTGRRGTRPQTAPGADRDGSARPGWGRPAGPAAEAHATDQHRRDRHAQLVYQACSEQLVVEVWPTLAQHRPRSDVVEGGQEPGQVHQRLTAHHQLGQRLQGSPAVGGRTRDGGHQGCRITGVVLGEQGEGGVEVQGAGHHHQAGPRGPSLGGASGGHRIGGVLRRSVALSSHGSCTDQDHVGQPTERLKDVAVAGSAEAARPTGHRRGTVHGGHHVDDHPRTTRGSRPVVAEISLDRVNLGPVAGVEDSHGATVSGPGCGQPRGRPPGIPQPIPLSVHRLVSVGFPLVVGGGRLGTNHHPDPLG